MNPYIENDLFFVGLHAHDGLGQRRFNLSASASPIPYTGSKSCIVKTILDVMPPHETYIEPCMGSAEVFFRKPPADREIINDYNGDLVNLFRVLQDNQNLDKVIGRLYLSVNAELLFRQNKRRSNTTYYWAYKQYGIWGLTARFLVRFKDILLAGEYQPTWKR